MTEHSPHVLVVEDDRLMAKYVALLLLTAGYTVTVAHTAIRGARLAGLLKPACLIWDIGLLDSDEPPWVDPTFPTVPTVILTGRQQAAGVPAHAEWLVKPAESSAILDAVERRLLLAVPK